MNLLKTVQLFSIDIPPITGNKQSKQQNKTQKVLEAYDLRVRPLTIYQNIYTKSFLIKPWLVSECHYTLPWLSSKRVICPPSWSNLPRCSLYAESLFMHQFPLPLSYHQREFSFPDKLIWFNPLTFHRGQ